jgi:hypothetical protein
MAILLKNFDPQAMFVWLKDIRFAGKDVKRGDVVAKGDVKGIKKLMQLYLTRKIGYEHQLLDKVGGIALGEEGAKVGLLDKLKEVAKEVIKDKAEAELDKALDKVVDKTKDFVEKKVDKASQGKKK